MCKMNVSSFYIALVSFSHWSIHSLKAFSCLLYINAFSNNIWVKLASVSVFDPFPLLHDPFWSSLNNKSMSSQPRPSHYPLCHSLFLSANSHLHYSSSRLTILFSVSIISKVFSLDTALTSPLQYNKYTFVSLSFPLTQIYAELNIYEKMDL